jgi:transcription elongation GreA/GreB family factor
MLDKNHRPRKRPSVKASARGHVIGVGSRVSVRDLTTGELEIYTLVLPVDADISRHWVSTFTPLGGAIVGRKAGDLVEFMAPGGPVKIRIESAQKAPLADAPGMVS